MGKRSFFLVILLILTFSSVKSLEDKLIQLDRNFQPYQETLENFGYLEEITDFFKQSETVNGTSTFFINYNPTVTEIIAIVMICICSAFLLICCLIICSPCLCLCCCLTAFCCDYVCCTCPKTCCKRRTTKKRRPKKKVKKRSTRNGKEMPPINLTINTGTGGLTPSTSRLSLNEDFELEEIKLEEKIQKQRKKNQSLEKSEESETITVEENPVDSKKGKSNLFQLIPNLFKKNAFISFFKESENQSFMFKQTKNLAKTAKKQFQKLIGEDTSDSKKKKRRNKFDDLSLLLDDSKIMEHLGEYKKNEERPITFETLYLEYLNHYYLEMTENFETKLKKKIFSSSSKKGKNQDDTQGGEEENQSIFNEIMAEKIKEIGKKKENKVKLILNNFFCTIHNAIDQGKFFLLFQEIKKLLRSIDYLHEKNSFDILEQIEKRISKEIKVIEDTKDCVVFISECSEFLDVPKQKELTKEEEKEEQLPIEPSKDNGPNVFQKEVDKNEVLLKVFKNILEKIEKKEEIKIIVTNETGLIKEEKKDTHNLNDEVKESSNKLENEIDKKLKNNENVKLTAMYKFESSNPEELNFEKYERITILKSSSTDGWYDAKNEEGEKGLVPFNYFDLSVIDVAQ